jgi:hypothetical protein
MTSRTAHAISETPVTAANSTPDTAFDYACAAELFPTRSRKPRRTAHSYRRFSRAADAIRYAIEELPRDLLLGACLQVEEERFGSAGIRKLYDSERYPLKRPAAPRQ